MGTNSFFKGLCTVTVLATIVAILISIYDRGQNLRWLSFSLWIVPGIICFVATAFYIARQLGITARYDKRLVAVVVVIILLSRFFAISSYPFSAIHDEIRDGGLRGQEIALGIKKDIFGTDWSQGLLFANITSLVYKITGPDVLMYRSVGALTSSIELILLFLGLSIFLNPISSALITLTLATNGAYMFFARTEALISFSTFFCSLAILSVLCVRVSYMNLLKPLGVWWGLLLGLSFLFHASLRVPVLALFFICVLFLILRSVKRKIVPTSLFAFLILVSIFAIVGLGPNVFFISKEFITGSGRLIGEITSFGSMIERYMESLGVIYSTKLSTHFNGEMLLTKTCSIILIVGMVLSLFRGSMVAKLSLGIVFLVPLTNSALTEGLNQTQRILPLVVFSSIIIGETVARVVFFLMRRNLRVIGIIICVLFVFERFYEAGDFFFSHRATRHMSEEINRPFAYALMHVVKHVNSSEKWSQKTRMYIGAVESEEVYKALLPPHTGEFFQFFFRGKDVVIKPLSNELSDRAIYIFSEDASEIKGWKEIVPCPDAGFFACPNISPIRIFEEW